MPRMPLTMRPTGLQSPAHRDQSDFIVLSGRLVVGRIYRIQAGPQQGRWFWAVSGVHAEPAVMRISDRADTLDLAKAQLAENWRKWLSWARLKEIEETVVPEASGAQPRPSA
jgi:hypothetical protein